MAELVEWDGGGHGVVRGKGWIRLLMVGVGARFQVG